MIDRSEILKREAETKSIEQETVNKRLETQARLIDSLRWALESSRVAPEQMPGSELKFEPVLSELEAEIVRGKMIALIQRL